VLERLKGHRAKPWTQVQRRQQSKLVRAQYISGARVSWNRGLTKETDSRVARGAQTLSNACASGTVPGIGTYKRTLSICRRNSLGLRRFWSSQDAHIVAQRNAFLEKLRSVKRGRQISTSLLRAYASNPAWVGKKNRNLRKAARKLSRRKRLSVALRGHEVPQHVRAKISASLLRTYHEKPELRARLSRSLRCWRKCHPVKAQRALMKSFKGNRIRPNGREKKLFSILKHSFPGLFQINCVWSGRMIGGKIPDFICRKFKLLVELFGMYWHGKRRTGRNRGAEESQRRRHFAKLGFSTVVVWDKELDNKNVVVSKIKTALCAVGG
jgi:very-short-patch-repair endonuclease